jgi:Protein of unknown function (DUF3592)
MGLFLAYLTPAIFLFVCLVLWAVAAVLFFNTQRRNAKARRVTGQITGHGQGRGRGGQLMYYAQFSADVGDGQIVTGRSRTATSWQSGAVGSRVELYYNPEVPDGEAALTEAGFLPYLAPAILAGTGMSLAAGALIMALFVHLQISKRAADVQRTARPPSAAHSDQR